MEFLNFLKIVRRYRFTLILVPVFTAIIAYFLVQNMPDKYVSHARLASSVANKSQQLVSDNMQQESRVNEEFDNLLQTLTLDMILDQVSYKLLIHDLETPKPFRSPSSTIESLSPAEKNAMIAELAAHYNGRKPVDPLNAKEKELHKALKSMKYDNAAIRKSLIAFRMGRSEYINLEYTSESPRLSAFVLNTLSSEFINYYTSISSANKNRSVRFLDSLTHAKQEYLLAQTDMLKKYKIDNGILNVDDQARTIYGQIADIEAKKTNAEKDKVAYAVALNNIDSRFKPENRKYMESSVSGLNSDIMSTKDQIKSTNDAYVQSGFDAKYKTKMDSLQKKLTNQIHAQTDNYAYNPLSAKENLVTQKLNLEVSKDLAQNSVQSLNNELGRLNRDLQKLVPNLATIQVIEDKIAVANKEYLEVLQKYNQASLEANYAPPVRLVEKALPGDASPSKKIMLVALATLASLVLSLLVIFLIFYFDKSIQSPDQLESSLGMPVIGSLNRINGEFLNLHDLWSEKIAGSNSMVFKNSLRSIRLEIENDLKDGSILTVTSLNEGEGKTFFTIALAYAFAKVNKKVLVIDGNFMKPDISHTTKSQDFIEEYLAGNKIFPMSEDTVNVIGNQGGDSSLLEISNTRSIEEFFRNLRSIYDVIIVETSALDSLNKSNAKEWISFTDKLLVVFESGRVCNVGLGEHLNYLKKMGSKLTGLVMNKVVTDVEPVRSNFRILLDKPKNASAAFGV